MLAPTGDQYPIRAGGYRAVVTESGAVLRQLEYQGRALIDGFAEDEMPAGGRGQLLMPWPNRIEDGRYEYGGTAYQLPLTEPKRNNASHGLARWVAWTLEEHTTNSVSFVYRLMAQSGYPWTVDLHVLYDLSADGLTVTQTATNMSGSPAPYASGAHPYLQVGHDGIDGLELTLPAGARSLTDERKLPTERVRLTGEDDFADGRVIGSAQLDHAYTDLRRNAAGRTSVRLREPGSGRGVALWVDEHHKWLQVYTADDVPATARRSLAVEPMTAQANAFRTGEDLVTLSPAGSEGDELSVTWGIRALG